MEDNKLYIVLRHFDKIEQNRLRKYIRSPYFNVNETLMIFYDILTDNINKNGKAGSLTKEMIWKKLYGKESYNDVRFRKLGSDLLKLVEGFLAQEIYDENALNQSSNLIEAVSRKKIDKLYNSSVKNAELTTEQRLLRPASFYYYQYSIEKNYYDLMDVDLKRSEKSNVEKIINSLDEFYLAEKLKWHGSLLSRQSLVSHEYQLLFIDEIITHVKKYQYKNVPPVSVYFHSFLTQSENDNEQHYYNLIEELNRNYDFIPKKELYTLYTSAINYCISKINKGKPEFLREFINLVKHSLEDDILISESETGFLNPWHFKNIVLSALRLGEYDWTEKFIKDYKDKLPTESRDNAVSYNLALVYFYQKKFDKVKELLREVEYEDMAYNLGSKSMLLAIYYEQDEDDALFSLMDTFKTYLHRHREISEFQRVSYMNLVKYIKKMRKIVPGDKKEIDKIKEEIEEDKKVGIASMRWVLEKLAELE